MFHEDCFVSFRRPCARDLILSTVRARSNWPPIEQAQMLFADSSSANASAKRGLSATKQNVQMEVKQQDTVCRLPTNPIKKQIFCCEPSATAKWNRMQPEIVVVFYFTSKVMDNMRFLCKFRVVPLPYGTWHSLADEERLWTRESEAVGLLSLLCWWEVLTKILPGCGLASGSEIPHWSITRA